MFAKQEPKPEKRDESRQKSRQPHHRNIFPELYPAGGSEINIRGIADDEHHAPRICRDEFPHEVGHGADAFLLAETTDEGREREHDDVVGGEYGENGHERIKTKKQLLLAAFGPTEKHAGQTVEKAEFVEIDGKESEADEQGKNFQRVHLPRSGQSRPRLLCGQNAAKKQKSPRKRGKPIDAEIVSFDADGGLQKDGNDQSRTSGETNDYGKNHTFCEKSSFAFFPIFRIVSNRRALQARF